MSKQATFLTTTQTHKSFSLLAVKGGEGWWPIESMLVRMLSVSKQKIFVAYRLLLLPSFHNPFY